MCRYIDPRGPGRLHLGVRLGQEGGGAVFITQAADGTVVVCAHEQSTDGPDANQAVGPAIEFTLSAERWHAALAELKAETPVKKQVRPKRAKR